jgi:diaminohydroxyphosphoribosylaminopyrimidine deaminase/5-amino-6-(5-phosphoribosylamino)uracil reductase
LREPLATEYYIVQMNNDERFMREALGEAKKSAGQTSPNPAVGAVLVLGNRVVSRGHHRRAGLPHAEIECLQRFKRSVPKGAVLYVTLEPCSSVGRTGACTEAIIRSGVKTVVIGMKDPNPRHRGRGLEILQNSGIEVRSGVLAEECARLNEAFNKWIATGIPFVIAKCGMSLDGRLTLPKGEGQWITSAAARRDAQTLRAQSDAILIGAETLRIDNPRLTVRNPGASRQPIRVVMTRSGKLPRRARIFTDRNAKQTLVYRDEPLGAVLADLGKKDVVSVTIEGGGDVLGHALDQRLIDKVQIYIAPIFSGGGVTAFAGDGSRSTSESARLDRIRFEKIGPDLCLSGYPKYSALGATE